MPVVVFFPFQPVKYYIKVNSIETEDLLLEEKQDRLVTEKNKKLLEKYFRTHFLTVLTKKTRPTVVIGVLKFQIHILY